MVCRAKICSYFFLEYALELRIIVLRMKKIAVVIVGRVLSMTYKS